MALVLCATARVLVVSVNIKFDVSGERELMREMQQLAAKVGLVNEDFVEYAAGVAQRVLVRNVQPFGLGGKAKELGEKAVWEDLRNAFKIVPNDYRGRDLVTGISEAHNYHQGVRNSKGRVGSVRAFRKNIKYDLFQRYGREVIKRVGSAKGGFSVGLRKYGYKSQQWIRRHQGKSNLRRSINKGRVSLTLDNLAKHSASDYVMGERGLRRVKGQLDKQLRNSLKGKLRRAGIPF